jgi:hypothetical protein
MDNILALGLTILLLLRVLPWALGKLSPRFARRLHTQMQRFQALIDIAGGTLMGSLVVLLLWHRAWIPAVLLAVVSYPSLAGLVAGFRLLARTNQR